MHNIKELKILDKATTLAIDIYRLTAQFPDNEKFGLVSQIRRCAVSVPSNIAEGAGRNTNGEFVNFLGIANGSLYELQIQITIAHQLKFIVDEDCEQVLNRIDELQKMNYRLQESIKNKHK